jgi:peptide/nickel transport system permease protein
MMQQPMIAIAPGLALAITVYGIVMFGDALRDLLDPKLRGGAGSYVLTEKIKQKLQRNALNNQS